MRSVVNGRFCRREVGKETEVLQGRSPSLNWESREGAYRVDDFLSLGIERTHVTEYLTDADQRIH